METKPDVVIGAVKWELLVTEDGIIKIIRVLRQQMDIASKFWKYNKPYLHLSG